MSSTTYDLGSGRTDADASAPRAGPRQAARRLAWLTAVAAALGLCVAVFGAFVRLSDAGLSCPDWPGCYGKLLVPAAPDAVAAANAAFPERPVDGPRAWLEMIHRYAASLLGLAIVVFCVLSWRLRRAPGVRPVAATGLLALVLLQGALGMWTVTLMLKPIVVTAHLLGGFTTVALLWWLTLRQSGWQPRLPVGAHRLTGAAVAVLAVVYVQVTLGAWTSTNYAALSCPDFPLCQGQVIPTLALADALHPWQADAATYEGGILDNDARVTIHFLHRVGALLTLCVVGAFAWRLWRAGGVLRSAAAVLAGVLTLQIALGITNVVAHLPIAVATGHNAGAALLLLACVSVYHLLRPANPTGDPDSQ